MGTVTEPGFHNGRFRQGGQYAEVEAETINLGGLTRDELVALAMDRGVQHSADATESEIVAAITTAG